MRFENKTQQHVVREIFLKFFLSDVCIFIVFAKPQDKCKHKNKYKYTCVSCEETHCEKCYTASALWANHSVCPVCENLVENFDGYPIRDDYFHEKCIVEHLRVEHPPLER